MLIRLYDYVDGIPTRKEDGSLTDWGKHLQVQQDAFGIASNYKLPSNYNSEKGMYGGLDPSYETYVAYNVGLGNNVLDRDRWQQGINEVYYPQNDLIDRKSSINQNSPINTNTSQPISKPSFSFQPKMSLYGNSHYNSGFNNQPLNNKFNQNAYTQPRQQGISFNRNSQLNAINRFVGQDVWSKGGVR